MPKISIITPTYNRANLLRDAISSVLNQTYQNFELIIVDDFSSDDTEKMVEGFKDQRIVYLKHSKNRGFAASLNTGLKKATGDNIFLLDDDELIVPWALEKLIGNLEQSDLENIGGVYGWSWWITDQCKTRRIIDSQIRGYVFNEILKRQVFTNVLIKREVYNQVGLYDGNLGSNEDFDFYLRMSKKFQIDFVPEILMVIRSHSGSHLSSFSKRGFKVHAEIFKKYNNDRQSLRILIALIASDLNPAIYTKLSNFKNYAINKTKLFLNPEIRKEIKLIKEELKERGIKI